MTIELIRHVTAILYIVFSYMMYNFTVVKITYALAILHIYLAHTIFFIYQGREKCLNYPQFGSIFSRSQKHKHLWYEFL